uniref:Uncharacterized protein n=1 Tax=Thermosporothrix sp. COM3 TaxID=2490863 RepID=A0A455SF93_9CHLR|nr:hypothetical protein KTC_11670 [Thermosporothrix sp. COM3]BBH86417.1 hypothetical protein KTC_11680 [Thermosporothrix sp. COM3]
MKRDLWLPLWVWLRWKRPGSWANEEQALCQVVFRVWVSLIAAEEGEVRKRKGEADAAEKRGVCAGEDERDEREVVPVRCGSQEQGNVPMRSKPADRKCACGQADMSDGQEERWGVCLCGCWELHGE